MFRDRTLPKLTGETWNFFQVFWKKYNFMHFERSNNKTVIDLNCGLSEITTFSGR